jgi:TolB-like protein/Tfp pilus assembly protein PilF
VLAEFASVVDAVRCAGEIQQAMVERDLDVAEERRLRFRIGVNLGDVIADGGDIYGDGVNIAARLEGLAAPGSVCISGTVRDHIGDRLPYDFEDLGQQAIKNIARPVRVFALRPKAVGHLPTSSGPLPASRRRGAARIVISTIAAAMLVVGVGAWWLWPAVKPPAAPAVTAAASTPPPLAAPRLSIIVLPFINLSNEPDQQYFADGITEDLTTDLSRIPHMFVISRNTAFTFRNKPVDTKQIGHDLAARYLLEGSVQRSGNQVRVTAQLIDAETDAHLWAERFDRDTGDLFILQNEITSRIASALNVQLITMEAARPTEHPDALDYILRGRAALLKPESRDSFAEAISLFEHALSLDPQSVEAQTMLAGSLANRVLTGLTALANTGLATLGTADLVHADELISRALAASPRYGLAHHVKGQVLRAQNRWWEAVREYETVLASNPNFVVALNGLAQCKLYSGSIDEVIPLEEQAIRRSPHDPQIGTWYGSIGMVHLLQSRTGEAIGWLEKARGAAPAKPFNHLPLAAAYALSGDVDRAATELAEARRLRGKGSFSSIARLKAGGFWGSLSPTRTLFEATYLAGLRKAGMPEE